ncbi:8-amino-3,8-dideoxy-manno-octulosonate cytidylyltransferase [Chlamydia avium]|uniref:3-deoxy-manno-octulosonate cytidylyltransferase n=2 Tax=Chlamydia avium TaxID=1457141 RepID=W8JQX4_9CHLA|nr:3-deoxy-manno-octulosonate cytidylyltransferase [Chlamydia avium]AHK63243.1 3-deoxy-manno-octulosonate cytidylyltransferase [Chlamydia avium 10DC88]EPP36663.1 3-deoxy-D-manno-octulosonate cytidylyltransferase [Chlamydia psittaci 10_743_SC13]EPP38299.1 3-deoxy-D-manno-octulosonate cytidylyltransferase [Chlamydia avium]VVT42845.1 8-amino-3,8-dideoxy-manno-octulosonate cytidylyltransferase [Chlamydia avium]
MKQQVFGGKRVGVLPSRHGSTRFPGKPLALILGKSLIQRAYENAIQSTLLDTVIVATDDERIMHHVIDFGGQCVMTSPQCANGTERIAEAASRYLPEADIIVNIQGDEPCLSPQVIDTLIEKLEAYPKIHIVTPVSQTTDSEEILTNHKVKCVFDKNGKALYFSRSPIPHILKKETPMYLHMGVYAFRRQALFDYVKLSSTPLNQAEDLEQLRILEHGGEIHICVVNAKSPSVDYPEDINKLEKYLTCHSIAFF